jgi:hypothetical protein
MRIEKLLNQILNAILILIAVECLSNAYKTFGTNYHTMYWCWVIAAVIFVVIVIARWMNRMLSVILVITLSTSSSFAQPYVGMGLQNKGAFGTAGYIWKNLDGQVQYKFPLQSSTESNIVSFSAGYVLKLPSNFNVTPLAGYAFSKRQSETNDGSMIPIKDNGFVAGIEVGKTWYKFKLNLFGRYYDKPYAGVGFVIFLD